jgi:hypothetical protein
MDSGQARWAAGARAARPATAGDLGRWLRAFTGVRLAGRAVCPGHSAPLEVLAEVHLRRPPVALVLGSRGAGKSFLAALDTHLMSRWHPGHQTRILGGSRAQSQQIYQAIRQVVSGSGPLGSDRDAVDALLKTEARYANGSDVSILAASSTSVRGPHVASLKLDEVDEIDPECREAAMGMCMARGGVPASVLMTSTWHRLDGPMSGLIERGRAGVFPFHTMCAFEVLERCDERRSGPNLENCPSCPIAAYCRDVADGGPPRAKRSDGHYAIDSLVQKMQTVSRRTFEADYLCLGPKADGLWFPGFARASHVREAAEYDPALPVHLAVDSGVFTGAVFFQVRKGDGPDGDEVRVFADYLAEDRSAERNARELLELARSRCNGRLDVVSTDPAGGARNPVGPTVIGEYERVGLRPLRRWPVGSVADGLALVESFVEPASGGPRLLVHPRCEATIRAFAGYRRARRGGQWQDHPEDPQHPHEDLLDALRGGLRLSYPQGRAPAATLRRVSARRVF